MQITYFTLKIAFLLFTLIICACSEKSSKVHTSPSLYCEDQRLKNQFIAHWYNSQPTLEYVDNVDQFVNKNFNKLNFIEPNYIIRIPPNVNEINPNITLSSSAIMARIGALSAMQRGYRGQNILVAVIDSGVDIRNPYLSKNIFRNRKEIPGNGIDDDQNGYVDDVHGWNFTRDNDDVIDEIGHGTSIAGIITGSRESGESLALAPDVKILPLDIMSSSTGSEYDAKKAVDYAMKMGAKIVNNSWSISCSEYLASAFRQYENHDVIFVNSAGNVYQNVYISKLMLSSLQFFNFLNVGSTDIYGGSSSFSGYGPTINIWAPGEQIPVITSSNAWGSLTEASGTSVSAAIITGSVAIVWSAYPSDNSKKIISRMLRGAFKIDGRNFVSIEKALPPLPEPTQPPPTVEIPSSPDSPESGDSGAEEET